MLDDILTVLRWCIYAAAALFFLYALPFVICHAVDSWDAPIHKHTGFTPEYPTHNENER